MYGTGSGQLLPLHKVPVPYGYLNLFILAWKYTHTVLVPYERWLNSTNCQESISHCDTFPTRTRAVQFKPRSRKILYRRHYSRCTTWFRRIYCDFMQIPCHWHQYSLTRCIPSSPICSLIFTRSEPPTIPTLTFCEKKSDFLGINLTPMTGIQYSSHALKKNDSTGSGSFYAVRLSILLKTLIVYF